MADWILEGPSDGPLFIFAHGAGAGMEHDFMQQMSNELVSLGIRVLRFNFPYMIKRAQDGKKRPPDRAPKLLEAFEAVIAEHGAESVVIGGKSMGGRMASLLDQHQSVAGIVCLGFPFHPPGKPENFKGEHLAAMSTPTLIVQGERDTFGNQLECQDFTFSNRVELHFLPDGDHSFKPRKASGFTQEQHILSAAERVASFIEGI